MTAPDQPPIVDQEAHNERVALDQAINALIDKYSGMDPRRDPAGYRQGLNEIRELRKRRAEVFRREVGWQQ